MKISNEIRNIYAEKKDLYKALGVKVRALLNAKKNARWHYEDRIKSLESYAMKLETGRFTPDIEDFFACTLVVDNLTARVHAEDIIKSEFKHHIRRPKNNNFTHKGSDSFPFDDLRIYVSWLDSGSKSSGFEDVVFEIQIKTFLQHAWSIATHDLIYKATEKDWAKERIAYQVKAMLEHAEISISEANTLSKSPALAITNKATNKLKRAIKILRSFWSESALPSDLTRLAENIITLISKLNITESELIQIIKAENLAGRGSNIINLSPFGCITQAIISQKPDAFLEYIEGSEQDYKILITKDIEVPDNIQVKSSRNVIIP